MLMASPNGKREKRHLNIECSIISASTKSQRLWMLKQIETNSFHTIILLTAAHDWIPRNILNVQDLYDKDRISFWKTLNSEKTKRNKNSSDHFILETSIR